MKYYFMVADEIEEASLRIAQFHLQRLAIAFRNDFVRCLGCIPQILDYSASGIWVPGICFIPQLIIAFRTGRRLFPRSVN